MNSSRSIAIAALVAGSLAAGLAQAHGSERVQWSVTVNGPVGVTVSSPAYPVVVPPTVVVVQSPGQLRHARYRQPTRWDVDGDGIPNRMDPVYNPRWDRDGDGIPNRWDHREWREGRHGGWR